MLSAGFLSEVFRTPLGKGVENNHYDHAEMSEVFLRQFRGDFVDPASGHSVCVSGITDYDDEHLRGSAYDQIVVTHKSHQLFNVDAFHGVRAVAKSDGVWRGITKAVLQRLQNTNQSNHKNISPGF